MEELQDEKLDVIPYPVNIQYDINIKGMTFDYSRAIQALFLAIALSVLVYFLCIFIHLKTSYTLVLLILSVCGGLYLGIKGINGDTVFRYIYNSLMFSRKKRTVYYNPRVKSEIKFITNDDGREDNVVPRDKIDEMISKYITKVDVKSVEENLSNADLDTSYMFFEDDIDVFGKPEELMSPKELKKYRKRKEKEAKEKGEEENDATKKKKVGLLYAIREKLQGKKRD